MKQLLAAGLGPATTCLQPQRASPAWHSLFGERERLQLPLHPLLPGGSWAMVGCMCLLGGKVGGGGGQVAGPGCPARKEGSCCRGCLAGVTRLLQPLRASWAAPRLPGAAFGWWKPGAAGGEGRQGSPLPPGSHSRRGSRLGQAAPGPLGDLPGSPSALAFPVPPVAAVLRPPRVCRGPLGEVGQAWQLSEGVAGQAGSGGRVPVPPPACFGSCQLTSRWILENPQSLTRSSVPSQASF